eukprot:TRINITY_DN74800_c0_g1_i1.p1 TRINITY_DN74800_c0_g1~~TRINITY_DN74800_c0_g1_i1.p1  ORF type:complete len:356 (-),score=29.52 TRINITY_DN74800_c0_g1_i1:79-1116(-)
MSLDRDTLDVEEAIQQGFTSMIASLETLTRTVQQQSHHFKALAASFPTKTSPATDQPQKNPQAEQDQDIVTLNVGGERFLTTRATLLKDEDSFFWSLAGGGGTEWKPDFNDGQEFFIDRSPESFKLVLDYLRSDNRLELMSSWTPQQRIAVHGEVDFFHLPQLKSSIAAETPEVLATSITLCWEDNCHWAMLDRKDACREPWPQAPLCCCFSHNNTWVQFGSNTIGLVWGKLTNRNNRLHPIQAHRVTVTSFRLEVAGSARINCRFGSPNNSVMWQMQPDTSSCECAYDVETGDVVITQEGAVLTTLNWRPRTKFDVPLPCVAVNGEHGPVAVGIMHVGSITNLK